VGWRFTPPRRSSKTHTQHRSLSPNSFHVFIRDEAVPAIWLAKGSFDKYEIESTAKISTRSLMLDFGIGYPGAASPPAAVSYASGQIALAVTGKDRQMWIRRFVDFPPTRLGSTPEGTSRAVSRTVFSRLAALQIRACFLGRAQPSILLSPML
jgi:hypothetical protein